MLFLENKTKARSLTSRKYIRFSTNFKSVQILKYADFFLKVQNSKIFNSKKSSYFSNVQNYEFIRNSNFVQITNFVQISNMFKFFICSILNLCRFEFV
jgi:hypothetical protein